MNYPVLIQLKKNNLFLQVNQIFKILCINQK